MRAWIRIVVPVAVLAVGIAGAVWMGSQGNPPEQRPAEQAAVLVETVRPAASTGHFIIRAQGTITPKIETSLVSEVTGKIVWLSDDFVAGGVFEAGQVLARVDPSDYRTALLAADAELASARATLADEQARSDAAREDFERLYGDSRTPSELLLRLPQVERARAAVQAQEAAVARAQRELERTEINLPFSGMVRARDVSLGQFVSVGTPLGTAFSTATAEIRLPLSQEDIAYLEVNFSERRRAMNLPVALQAKIAGTSVRRTASVVRTEGVIDANTRLVYLVAELEDPYALAADNAAALPMGTFVEAQIQGRSAEGLTIIPGAALRQGDQVYLANHEDRLEIVNVDVMRQTAREVYITDELGEAPRVIVTAIPTPIPGLRLNVRELPATEPQLRLLPAGGLAAHAERDAP